MAKDENKVKTVEERATEIRAAMTYGVEIATSYQKELHDKRVADSAKRNEKAQKAINEYFDEVREKTDAILVYEAHNNDYDPIYWGRVFQDKGEQAQYEEERY